MVAPDRHDASTETRVDDYGGFVAFWIFGVEGANQFLDVVQVQHIDAGRMWSEVPDVVQLRVILLFHQFAYRNFQLNASWRFMEF